MAGRGPRILIREALEDLGDNDQFPKFVAQMQEPRNDAHTPKRFRKNQVLNKTRVQLADVLVDAFGNNAVVITVSLLRAIGSNGPANDLEEEAEDNLPAPKRNSAGEAGASAPAGGATGAAAPSEHFVDKHRNVLIDRVSNVSAVLDHLLDMKVLMQEQYNKAMKIDTTEDQMRFLFSGPLKAAGERGKDHLQAALRKNELYLMEELQEK